jgi:hypothetical protein
MRNAAMIIRERGVSIGHSLNLSGVVTISVRHNGARMSLILVCTLSRGLEFVVEQFCANRDALAAKRDVRRTTPYFRRFCLFGILFLCFPLSR